MSVPISRPVHGIADYTYVATVAAALMHFGFENNKAASGVCRFLAGATLVYTIFTRAEWGLVRVIPHKKHLASEAVGGLLAIGAPWLFGFSEDVRARNSMLAFGTISMLASSLSEPEEMTDCETNQD